jgi:tRNA (pseudouridine54-N1)-methyltransferase
MRRYVITGHSVPITFGFSLDNLPGSGRMDLLCRALNAAFLKSHGIREDVEVYLVLQDEVALKFDGSELGGLNPDARSIAGVILKGVSTYADDWEETTPGVEAARKSLEDILDELEGTKIMLDVDGEPLKNTEVPKDPIFILSDHESFTDDEKALMNGFDRVSIGGTEIHTDHTVAVIQNWLDTKGFENY